MSLSVSFNTSLVAAEDPIVIEAVCNHPPAAVVFEPAVVDVALLSAAVVVDVALLSAAVVVVDDDDVVVVDVALL
ncbi:MAG: hypothetical protein ACJ70X_03620, partial [Nitrososphaera sp.]